MVILRNRETGTTEWHGWEEKRAKQEIYNMMKTKRKGKRFGEWYGKWYEEKKKTQKNLHFETGKQKRTNDFVKRIEYETIQDERNYGEEIREWLAQPMSTKTNEENPNIKKEVKEMMKKRNIKFKSENMVEVARGWRMNVEKIANTIRGQIGRGYAGQAGRGLEMEVKNVEWLRETLMQTINKNLQEVRKKTIMRKNNENIKTRNQKWTDILGDETGGRKGVNFAKTMEILTDGDIKLVMIKSVVTFSKWGASIWRRLLDGGKEDQNMGELRNKDRRRNIVYMGIDFEGKRSYVGETAGDLQVRVLRHINKKKGNEKKERNGVAILKKPKEVENKLYKYDDYNKIVWVQLFTTRTDPKRPKGLTNQEWTKKRRHVIDSHRARAEEAIIREVNPKLNTQNVRQVFMREKLREIYPRKRGEWKRERERKGGTNTIIQKYVRNRPKNGQEILEKLIKRYENDTNENIYRDEKIKMRKWTKRKKERTRKMAEEMKCTRFLGKWRRAKIENREKVTIDIKALGEESRKYMERKIGEGMMMNKKRWENISVMVRCEKIKKKNLLDILKTNDKEWHETVGTGKEERCRCKEILKTFPNLSKITASGTEHVITDMRELKEKYTIFNDRKFENMQILEEMKIDEKWNAKGRFLVPGYRIKREMEHGIKDIKQKLGVEINDQQIREVVNISLERDQEVIGISEPALEHNYLNVMEDLYCSEVDKDAGNVYGVCSQIQLILTQKSMIGPQFEKKNGLIFKGNNGETREQFKTFFMKNPGLSQRPQKAKMRWPRMRIIIKSKYLKNRKDLLIKGLKGIKIRPITNYRRHKHYPALKTSARIMKRILDKRGKNSFPDCISIVEKINEINNKRKKRKHDITTSVMLGDIAQFFTNCNRNDAVKEMRRAVRKFKIKNWETANKFVEAKRRRENRDGGRKRRFRQGIRWVGEKEMKGLYLNDPTFDPYAIRFNPGKIRGGMIHGNIESIFFEVLRDFRHTFGAVGNSFVQQVNGSPMGSPIGPGIAEGYAQRVERKLNKLGTMEKFVKKLNKKMKKMKNKVKIKKEIVGRMVDDKITMFSVEGKCEKWRKVLAATIEEKLKKTDMKKDCYPGCELELEEDMTPEKVDFCGMEIWQEDNKIMTRPIKRGGEHVQPGISNSGRSETQGQVISALIRDMMNYSSATRARYTWRYMKERIQTLMEIGYEHGIIFRAVRRVIEKKKRASKNFLREARLR